MTDCFQIRSDLLEYERNGTAGDVRGAIWCRFAISLSTEHSWLMCKSRWREPTHDFFLGPQIEHSDLAALGQLLVHAVQQRHHECGVAPAANQHVLQRAD